MNKIFSRNLSAMKDNHSFLAEILKDAKLDSSWVSIEQDGFLAHADGGQIVREFIDGKPENDVPKYPFHKDEATIIFGAGTGQLMSMVCRRKKKEHSVVVFEPETAILKFALENYDVSKYLSDGSLMIVSQSKPDELLSLLTQLEGSLFINDWIMFIEKYAMLKPSVYGAPIQKTQEHINHLKCNSGTVAMAGGQIAKNDIENLPYVIRHRGIDEFKDIYKGKPAVMVCTGPSLQKNIHQLQDMTDRVIIIAVGQALRILLAYGIEPDFICTVDFGEVNMTHYTGLMDCGVPLVALNRTYAPLLKQWQGPKIISATINSGFEDTLAGILSDRGALEQGGSVAHFTMSFALHLGCNPIIMVGSDLALSDGLSHNPNADSSGEVFVEKDEIKWRVKDPRSPTLNLMEHSMGPAITVPGYMGEPVLTNIGLASFITAFESIIKRAKAQGVTVINATEGGARIPEARQMALVKALRDYRALKDQEIDKTEVKALCSSLRKDWVEDINKAERIGGEEIDLLQEIIDTCIKALETNRKLSHLSAKKQRAEVEKLLKENEELSNKANALCDKNSLIKLYIYGASRQIQSKELKVNGKKEHILSNRKDMHTRLRRNELILMSAKTAAEELLICYKKTMDVFKEFKETGNWGVFYEKTDYQPSIKDAQTYLDKGNWARPYLDCLAIIESKAGDPSIREQTAEIFDQCLYLKILSISTAQEGLALREKEIEYRELVFMAQSEGREQKDFKKALDLLKEAITIFPDRPDALWGLATGLHYSGETKQSLQAYNDLVKKFPENKRFEFERNLVLIEDDVQRGAYEMSVFLINNEDYQYFWRNLGELFSRMGNIKKAVEAYKIYLQKFPIDDLAKTKLKELEECL